MSGLGKSVGGLGGFGIGVHPVLGSPVKPWIHWQLQTWLKGVPKALGPQGHCMQGSEQVKLLTSNLSLWQYLVVWQS
jgi:hypothetical protein